MTVRGAGCGKVARPARDRRLYSTQPVLSYALVINRQQLETRILSGLKERLMAPELVKAFVDEFNAEIRRSAQDSEMKRVNTRRTLTPPPKPPKPLISR